MKAAKMIRSRRCGTNSCLEARHRHANRPPRPHPAHLGQHLRANKLRSALTILGVVIGVTSIVAMTALIAGFSGSIRTKINQLGANTVYVEKAGFESFSSGRDFMELLRRPNLTNADAEAVAASPLVARVDVQAGDFGGPWSQQIRATYGNRATKRLPLVGTSARFPETNSIEIAQGRYFADFEVQNRHQVAVLGFTVADTLFPAADPIGKVVRMDGKAYTVVGVFGKRPSPLGDANAFVTVPWTTYEKRYDPWRFRGYLGDRSPSSCRPRTACRRRT